MDMNLAVTLLQRSPSLHTRDVIHAATMLHAGVRRILSTDRHFDVVKGIRRVDPVKLPKVPRPS